MCMPVYCILLHVPNHLGVNQGLPQTVQMAGIQTCVSAETAVGSSSLTWSPWKPLSVPSH
jgi:hypothetical protein